MPKTSSAEAARLAQAAAIAEAAYFKAEHRNFAPGFEIDDWLEAEREILGPTKARKPSKPRAKKNTSETSQSQTAAASSKPKESKSNATKKKAAKASG